jgi:outer membrane protein assembly factor BamB
MAELQGANVVGNLKRADDPNAPHDWPQWRGPRRDGLSLESGLNWNWPEVGPKKLWEAKSGEGYSTFAVAAGRVFTILQDGDDEAVVCWDANTGKEQWRFRYPAHFGDFQGSGPRSTPTIDGDRVYTVGATGVFHCLSAANGERIWRHDLLEEFGANNLTWGVSFSPLVEGDLVLTNPGGRGGKSVVAFDKISGDVAWQALDDSAGYSSPIAVTAAGRRQAIFFTGSYVLGIDPADGTVLWKYPWKNSTDVNAATPIFFSAQTGDAQSDYVFVSCNYGKGCCLLKLSATDDGIVPQRVYESTRMRNHFSSSVCVGTYLFGFDDNMLACMDLRTGEICWKQRGFDKGSLTIVDGRLVILGEYGWLAVADATPEEYREVASFQFSESKCWTVPVIANRRLYLRDESRLVCYDLGR